MASGTWPAALLAWPKSEFTSGDVSDYLYRSLYRHRNAFALLYKMFDKACGVGLVLIPGHQNTARVPAAAITACTVVCNISMNLALGSAATPDLAIRISDAAMRQSAGSH